MMQAGWLIVLLPALCRANFVDLPLLVPLDTANILTSSFPGVIDFQDMFPLGEEDTIKSALKPRPGVVTEITNKTEDGMHVMTVKQHGKNFKTMTQMATLVDDDSDRKYLNRSRFLKNLFSKIPGMFRIMIQDCSNDTECNGTQFCHPVYGECRDCAGSGKACVTDSQCCDADSEKCVWGVCMTSKPHHSGGICEKSTDCSPDSCCVLRKEINPLKKICVPRQGEGASCGSLRSSNRFFKRHSKANSHNDKCNPCLDGLSCQAVGLFDHKVCLPVGDTKEKAHD